MSDNTTRGQYNPQSQQQYGQQQGQQQGQQLLDDQTIAFDLLTAAKEAVKAYASALTEAATPEVRSVLHRQFEDSLAFQHEVADYVVGKGWYRPYDLQGQIQMDLQSSQQKLQSLQSVQSQQQAPSPGMRPQ